MSMDFNFYAAEGIIGTAQQPMNSTKWQYCRNEHVSRRNDLHSYISNWVSNYVTCDSSCADEISAVINEYDVNKSDFFNKADIFWDSLINSTFTEQIHKDYSTSLDAYMYSIRKIFSIFDGDRLNPKK